MDTVERAIVVGFEWGMFQVREEIENFSRWLVNTITPLEIALEIGAHRGGTSALLSVLMPSKVISVDLPDGPWGGIGVEAAQKRDTELTRLFPHYVSICADSQDDSTYSEIVKTLDGAKVDLLLIDGDHSYLGVKHDYERYKSLVREGGAVAFHDINDTQFHRDRGVMVSKLWRELPGEKLEFTANCAWGGIGVVRA